MIVGVSVPNHQVRASYTDQTITVYQSYPPEIAVPTLAAGRFVAPFKRDRMTWIKPSFLWMMYRSGWASKPGQEHILAVEIQRGGFESALTQACLSHFDHTRYPDRPTWAKLIKTSPVRVQWDPERSLHLAALPYRSLQIGLSCRWFVTGSAACVSRTISPYWSRTVYGLPRPLGGLVPMPQSRPVPAGRSVICSATWGASTDGPPPT
jgi:hypothetical protein